MIVHRCLMSNSVQQNLKFLTNENAFGVDLQVGTPLNFELDAIEYVLCIHWFGHMCKTCSNRARSRC